MSHRNAFHALDKTLQDLRGSSAIMGGATVVLAGQFANKLLQIGDGKVPEDPSTSLIIMPCGQIVNSPNELLSKVYPNIQQNFKDQDWLSHRAILIVCRYFLHYKHDQRFGEHPIPGVGSAIFLRNISSVFTFSVIS
ncbi:ATP-dependent DNA helicase [Trichonephila clavata]|uniref:ATP-dependent DNA helicase n=1 Tax=Trichonephila clavata TaxID=2740835 RepID=A0A8X6H5H3_TRICU|nr:ATP-dependent DNA helicase [Trichonephila clavata]